MKAAAFLLCMAIAGAGYAQQANTAAQREAMKKLEFLAGNWSGDASVTRGPGQPLKLRQSEHVEYKLDGLVMIVEGTGRNAEGKVVFQALATISYDDVASKYHIRAYNDGHYIDTELTVQSAGFAWGFDTGPAKILNAMHLDDKGDWVETTEATFSSGPPRRSVEMTLHHER